MAAPRLGSLAGPVGRKAARPEGQVRRRTPAARRGGGHRSACRRSSATPTATPTSAICPTGTAPRASRPTSSTAASTPARSSTGSAASSGEETFRREIAWREFYADVLFHRPESAHQSLQPAMKAFEVDEGAEADRRFAAWADGRTGYPIVDAGMRQLRAQAWMHNRVRMIVASFLVKDLHVDWRRGARHFMRLLVDGDLANNQHGWQWVAGTGTDPAPFFRIFNPVRQGEKFDPDGDVRPPLRPRAGRGRRRGGAQPWTLDGGLPEGYPDRIVDHDAERKVALARYAEIR